MPVVDGVVVLNAGISAFPRSPGHLAEKLTGVHCLDDSAIGARTQGEIDGKDLRGIRRGGYIASSVPLYWEDLLDPQTKAFKPAAELERIFAEKGIAKSDEVITYCQIGMRAAHDLFALALIELDGWMAILGYIASIAAVIWLTLVVLGLGKIVLTIFA